VDSAPRVRVLRVPVDAEAARSLRVGDVVRLTGRILTGRDAAHRYMCGLLGKDLSGEDARVYARLREICRGSFIYHCGPVMERRGGGWRCASAGPTTSMREEPYQAEIIRAFRPAGIIGKGGMGRRTAEALEECGAVYLQAVGGAGAVAAAAVEEVEGVLKEEFGMPEAMWILRVADFPAVVTMDSSGASIHRHVREESRRRLEKLLDSPGRGREGGGLLM